jgi:hypothetical protein
MSELAMRFERSPLATPAMLKPSAPWLEVTGAFNPGAADNVIAGARFSIRALPEILCRSRQAKA